LFESISRAALAGQMELRERVEVTLPGKRVPLNTRDGGLILEPAAEIPGVWVPPEGPQAVRRRRGLAPCS